MLPPEYFERLPEDVVQLFQLVEEDVLADIARRLVKAGGMTASAKWQAWRLAQLGEEKAYILSRLQRITGMTREELAALFTDAAGEALQYDDRIYEAAGLKPGRPDGSPALRSLLDAGMRQTLGTLRNLTRTTANTATKQFERALDRAWLQVTSGTFDYNTAIRRAIKEVALTGMQAVQYPSGHTDTLEVAVRRAVLTGVNQTAAKLSGLRAEEMGCDLVETTAHAGARPEHVVWQGRVFSRSGKHPRYPDFVSSTGYGTGKGLCGWNCRHSFHPYFEGLSETAYPRKLLREYENKTVSYNGETIGYYEATQRLRGIERQIRRWKREYIMLDAAGMGTTKAAVKLARWRETEKDFVRQTGIYKDSSRSQVEGFGRGSAAHAQNTARSFQAFRNSLVGLPSSVGVIVQEVSPHLMDQAKAREVTQPQLIEALTSPLGKGIIRADRSQQLIGEHATVAINVETGRLVTIWPTGKKKAAKWKETKTK